MFKNLKIKTKLFVIVTLSSVLAVLTISYVGFYTVKRLMVANKITMLEHIADLKVDKIESFFSERNGNILVTQDYFNIKSNFPIVTRFTADKTNPAYINAKKMLDDQIKTLQNAYACYIDFLLVSPEGRVVYSANELHEKIVLDSYLTGAERVKAFEQGKKGIYFSDIYVSEFEDYIYGMLVTAPVYGLNGQFIGVVAFEMNMNPIYMFIQETTGLEDTGETLIAKRVEDGALFLNSLRHDKGAALKRKAFFGDRSGFPILEAVQGRFGSGLSTDYRGKEIVAAWRHIHSFNWGLVAKMDLEEALKPVDNLKKTVFFIACFTIILAMTGAFWLSISITKPVKKLSDTVFKISRGNLDQRVDIKANDEIGQLANSFNIMAENLSVSNDELTKAKDYISNIIKTIADMIIVISQDYRIKTVNKATLTVLGYKEDELIGKPIGIIIDEDELFKSSKINELIKKGFITGEENSYFTRDGRKIPVLFSVSVMCDNGDIQGIVCAAQDITERKKLEEERQDIQMKMMQSGKLSSLGEIATGVAHEINQPLTYISVFLQNIQDDVEENIKIDETKLEKGANDAYEEVKRITSIIQHLRTFGRQAEVEMRMVSITTVFDKTLLLMGERLRLHNVNLIKNLGNDIPMVLGNANRLEEVFINLFQNACDAFDQKTKNAEIHFTVSLSDGKDSIIIEVSDNGMGMEKKTQEMVFEPFFTTKEVGKGTGLGLSIVYGTIKEHKGSIVCKSEPDKGTAFEIRLPVERT